MDSVTMMGDGTKCVACGREAHFDDFLGAFVHSDGEDHAHNVVTWERPSWISVVWGDDRLTYAYDVDPPGAMVQTHDVRRTIYGFVEILAGDRRAYGFASGDQGRAVARPLTDSFVHRELIGRWVRHCPTLVIR